MIWTTPWTQCDVEVQFNVIDLATGWKIDFIIRKSRPFSETEFERRSEVHFEGLRLHIAQPEDVIIAKLEWAKRASSERQIEDVAGILKSQICRAAQSWNPLRRLRY